MQRVVSLVFLLAAAVFVVEALPDGAKASPPVPEEKTPSEQSLAIVVNQSNPVENLSFVELRRIFLGERSHWPNGRRITLVMMEAGQPERKAVLRDIYQMNETDFNNHFLQGVFTGEVFVSPKTLATSGGVCKFVFNVPGAIGYVRASAVEGSVKVVRIDGHLPDDKDYRLRLQPRSGK